LLLTSLPATAVLAVLGILVLVSIARHDADVVAIPEEAV